MTVVGQKRECRNIHQQQRKYWISFGLCVDICELLFVVWIPLLSGVPAHLCVCVYGKHGVREEEEKKKGWGGYIPDLIHVLFRWTV